MMKPKERLPEFRVPYLWDYWELAPDCWQVIPEVKLLYAAAAAVVVVVVAAAAAAAAVVAAPAPV